jgi:uncharacterized protein
MHDEITIVFLIFIVATLYSSVGHGGASGYLAVLSLFNFPTQVMASTALVLNVLVAGLSWGYYIRAGYPSWRLVWPFLVGSVPAAYVGGLLKLAPGTYYFLLAATLMLVAFRLATDSNKESGTTPSTATQSENGSASPSNTQGIRFWTAMPCGAVIGLLSGMVGIGGGVFLTPLIVLMKWAPTKSASSASAIFIVINSIAGLLGRASAAPSTHFYSMLIVPAFLGGVLGSWLGANKIPAPYLKKLLALVLVIAAGKLILLVLH